MFCITMGKLEAFTSRPQKASGFVWAELDLDSGYVTGCPLANRTAQHLLQRPVSFQDISEVLS